MYKSRKYYGKKKMLDDGVEHLGLLYIDKEIRYEKDGSKEWYYVINYEIHGVARTCIIGTNEEEMYKLLDENAKAWGMEELVGFDYDNFCD